MADGEAGARHQGHQQQQRRTDRGAHRETGEGSGHPRQEEKGRFSSEIYRDYLRRPSLKCSAKEYFDCPQRDSHAVHYI